MIDGPGYPVKGAASMDPGVRRVRKSVIIGVAGVLAIVAGATGAWYLGKARLESGIDARIAALAGQSVRVRIGQRAVSGFPFAYDIAFDDVVVEAADGGWSLSLPWVHSRVTLSDRDLIRTTIAPLGRLDVAPQQDFGDAALIFAVASRDLVIDTHLDEDRTKTTLSAAAVSLDHTAPAGVRVARFTLSDLAATHVFTAPDTRDLTLAARAMTVATDVDTAGGGRRTDTTTLDDVTLRARGAGWNAPSFPVFVNTGGQIDVALDSAGSTSSGTVVAGYGAPGIAVSGATGPGSVGVGIADGRVAYRIAVRDARYSFAGPPIGGTIAANRAEMAFEMPIRPTAEPEPYALTLRLEGATADEAVWAQIDPEGRLRRDPVTLVAVVGGAARMVVDIAHAAESSIRPVDVRTVDITELSLDAIGARAALSGTLTLVPGADVPDGTLSVRLENWQKALDDVAALGLLPPDQVQMAATLVQTYGRPGDAPGVLLSEIRLRGGSITANGRRVR